MKAQFCTVKVKRRHAHEHTHLTGPAADEAARRLETFGERARFQGNIVLDASRLRRLMARHDPAVYPGEYITCVHDHTKALCETARHRRSEGLPDHGGRKPPRSSASASRTPASGKPSKPAATSRASIGPGALVTAELPANG